MARTQGQKRCGILSAGRVGVFSALALISVLSLSLRGERLPAKTYTVADGLLRDSVLRIRQDSRGFLWFCTAEGVSRFDGTAMTSFTVADGLPDRFVLDFLETKSGAIYIATGKGLARLNPHGARDKSIANRKSQIANLFTIFLPDNPKAERITTLFEDKNGRVLVGTSDGVYKLIENGEQTALEPVALSKAQDETLFVNEIIEDRRGALWVGTRNALFWLAPDGGGARRLTTADKLANNDIGALLEDRDGQIWAGFRNGGGLCLLDAETVEVKKCYSAKDGLAADWVTDLLQTSDGKIWAATVEGLCLWQGAAGGGDDSKSVCKTYGEKNDLCRSTSALAEDKDGNLWTGGDCGAKKVARYGFTTYTQEDGLDYADVNSIFENRAGELFVANNPSGGRKISRFDGGKFITVASRLPDYVNYYGWGWQQTLWQDSAGAWWIPTGYGLFRSPDNTTFENLARARLESVETGLKIELPESQKRYFTQKYGAAKVAEMKLYEIFRLFEDSRGDVWIATTGYENGLLRWERAANVWHNYTRQAGLSAKRVISAFAEDRHGNIWIGTGSDDSVEYYEGLLMRYRDGEIRRFTEKESAPRGWARDLFVDSRGRLWIASTQDGLLQLDETNANVLNFARYTTAEGLTSNATASVTEDQFGRIYVGTWRGIDRLNLDTGQIENFTAADGLPGSFVENAYRDRNNNLWFSTPKGLARFQPEPPRQRKPPVILITGLRVEGEPQTVSILGETEIPLLELGSDQNEIGVDFLGLGASLGEKLKYEYRMGDSGDWTTTAERSLNFANLAPGEYRFEVRAATADGIYSESPAAFSFRIAAPLWQRPWFLVFAALALGLIIYLIYRNRLRRLLEIERTRTRIATDLHDDIGTNLSKISLLSEIVNLQLTGGDEKNRQMLASIAEISRESVASMSDIVWAINPRRDSLDELTSRMREHAEEIFVEKGVRVFFDAPADGDEIKLSMNTRRDLFLIFKEAIANAAKHSACRQIGIGFRLAGGKIFLRITDDGRGFDLARRRDGNGLENMRRRAEANGGKFAVESKRGRGTTVKVEFPQN